MVAQKIIEAGGSSNLGLQGELLSVIVVLIANENAIPPLIIFSLQCYQERFLTRAAYESDEACRKSSEANETLFCQFWSTSLLLQNVQKRILFGFCWTITTVALNCP